MIFRSPVLRHYISEATTRKWVTHEGIRKWFWTRNGWNKFGLYHDDLVCLEQYPFNSATDGVYNEALRRLPSDLYDQFVYRNIRASQLEITKTYLGPEEAPTYEEDETKGRFLEPFVREILEERKEKEDWQDFLARK